jgi:dihydroorotate dehydrogenase (fumarate)
MENKKIDLSIKIANVSFNSPLFLSEGPLSGNKTLIERAAKHKLGAIVTKSMRNEKSLSPNPYMIKANKGLINADWTDIGFESWLKELENLKIDKPLIANVATNHVDPKTAAEYATILQTKGASLVTFSDYEPENLVDAVRYARKNVTVPIMVKLPPFRKDIGKLCRELENVGVNCIAAMDAVGPAMDIDIDTGKNSLGCKDGFGYLSSEPIFPLTLAYISEICKNVEVPVLAVGGVVSYKEVVKLIMAGATAVGISGGAILHGLSIFDKINDDLIKWMSTKGYTSLSDFRAITNKNEIYETYNQKAQIDQEKCISCGLCVKSCFQQAIHEQNKKFNIDQNSCVGCGVCGSVCIANAIKLG